MDLENRRLSDGGLWFIHLCIRSTEHNAGHTVGAQGLNIMHSTSIYQDLPRTGSCVLSLSILLF